MFKKVRFALVSALAVAAIGIAAGAYMIGGGGAAQADNGNDVPLNHSNVYKFADGSAVGGASSTLVRTKSGITATLNTDELKEGNAYTMWWVIFNNPGECEFGTPLTTCGEGDVFGMPLGNTDVQVSVQLAAGNIVGGTGKGNFGAHLQEGDIPTAPGQHVFGPGLFDSKQAEVHLVVRDHGPVIPGMEEAQLTTFGAACTAATDPTVIGPVGPYDCVDEQFAAYIPGNGNN